MVSELRVHNVTQQRDDQLMIDLGTTAAVVGVRVTSITAIGSGAGMGAGMVVAGIGSLGFGGGQRFEIALIVFQESVEFAAFIRA